MFVAFLFSSFFGIVTTLRAGGLWFESRQEKEIYIFSETSRPALGLTHPPIQWTTRALPPELQWRGREFNRSPPPSIKVKNEWKYSFSLSSWRATGTALPLPLAGGKR